jgi:hypothetical protein
LKFCKKSTKAPGTMLSVKTLLLVRKCTNTNLPALRN